MAVTSETLGQQMHALIDGAQFDTQWHASDEKIFMAALELFSELGFHGTSTRAIAQRAGMSPGALYSHYESKGDILYRIVRITHEGMLRQMQITMTRTTDLTERLRALVSCHVRYHATMSVAARVANYELNCLEPERRAEIGQLRQLIEATVRDTLLLAEGAGEVKVGDIDLATIMIVSLGIDVSRWFRPGKGRSPDELAEFYAQHVIDMFAVRPATAAGADPKPAPTTTSARR
jgi:AcrR family transcriptional regulator